MVIRYLVDQYKTQQICNKFVRGNGVTIESVPNCYNNNQICNKAVDNYPNALKFSPD